MGITCNIAAVRGVGGKDSSFASSTPFMDDKWNYGGVHWNLVPDVCRIPSYVLFCTQDAMSLFVRQVLRTNVTIRYDNKGDCQPRR